MEAPHEYGVKYDSKRRFVSYWYQIREVISCKPQRVLEVGVGNGFVSRYLREQGVAVTTVDIEATLRPDVIADITKLPFSDASYDVVTAYEVLEHMPYEKSLMGLQELHRVSSCYVIMSLPDATHAFRLAFTIPRMGYVQKVYSIPTFLSRTIPYAKSHEWEIGVKGYSHSKLLTDISGFGFRLVRSYRLYENPYHRFFILRKINTP